MKNTINILLACDANKSRPWFRDRIPAIKHAINNVEWSCEIVDIYALLGEHKYMPTDTKVRKRFLQTTNMIKINHIFESMVIAKKPDVLLLGTADNYREILMPRTIANIRKNGILVAGIFGDDEFNYHQYRFFTGWFDSFVAYVKPCIEYYESFDLSKGYYLPNSCYLNGKEFLDHQQTTKYDAILIGSPIANRPAMVKALIDSGIRLAVYGSAQWKKYDYIDGCYFGFVSTEKFDETLKQSKMVLAFLEDHATGGLHMNTKIWEAVRVARMPVVTLYKGLIEDYGLTDGVDIVMYENTRDLVKKVNYYAKHESERIQISKNIYNKVRDNLDYSTLYSELFNSLMDDFNSNGVGDHGSMMHSDVLLRLKDDSRVSYFPSSSSVIDPQVLNIIKIAKSISSDQKKIDLIYFDRIENGVAILQRVPFVSLDSVIFFTPVSNKLNMVFVLIKSFVTGRALHVKQFCVVTNARSMVGLANNLLDRVIYNSISVFLKGKIYKYRFAKKIIQKVLRY
ncbi:MAG: glycosyltransferase [Sedimenticola sp.]